MGDLGSVLGSGGYFGSMSAVVDPGFPMNSTNPPEVKSHNLPKFTKSPMKLKKVVQLGAGTHGIAQNLSIGFFLSRV